MKHSEQTAAFDRELHSLILRYFNEFDIAAEDMLEIMVREEMLLIAMAVACAEENGDLDLSGDEGD